MKESIKILRWRISLNQVKINILDWLQILWGYPLTCRYPIHQVWFLKICRWPKRPLDLAGYSCTIPADWIDCCLFWLVCIFLLGALIDLKFYANILWYMKTISSKSHDFWKLWNGSNNLAIYGQLAIWHHLFRLFFQVWRLLLLDQMTSIFNET